MERFELCNISEYLADASPVLAEKRHILRHPFYKTPKLPVREAKDISFLSGIALVDLAPIIEAKSTVEVAQVGNCSLQQI